MGRVEARQAAMQLLYEELQGGDADAYSLALCYALLYGKDADQAMMDGAEDAAGAAAGGAPNVSANAGASAGAGDAADAGAMQEARWLQTVDAEDRAYIDRVLDLMPLEQDRIDERIARHSQGWTIDRMARVDLSILRLAVLEMTRMPDIPDSVSINEALDLAAKYSEPRSGRFINGVLGAIWRELRGAGAATGKDSAPSDGVADGAES